MVTPSLDWTSLLALIGALVVLVFLERWIHQHLHGVALLATGSAQMALWLYALPLLPGVALHELSHWLMAKLLRVKTASLKLLPKKQTRGHIQLGSVTVQQTDAVRASLIGVAPLISGSLVVLLMARFIFGDRDLEALQTGDVGAISSALVAALRARDVWLWLYLVFAVANAMLPSPADREPWLPVILFLVVVIVLAYVLGFSSLLLQLAPLVAVALRWLALAFAVTIVADLPFVVLIALSEWMLGRLRGQRVYYKK